MSVNHDMVKVCFILQLSKSELLCVLIMKCGCLGIKDIGKLGI